MLKKYCYVICTSIVDFGFTTLLTSEVISVAFYIEHEESDKFSSVALISAWGSFTCHKSMTWDPRLYFPFEGGDTQDFYALKKIHRPWPGLNLRTLYPVVSMITMAPLGLTISHLKSTVFRKKSLSN